MRVLFTANFNWECKDRKCNCQTVTAYRKGWEGVVRKEIGEAAIAKNKAVEVEVGDGGDN